MKKLLFVSLVIVLVFGLILSGCGESEKVTTTKTATATKTVTATEPEVSKYGGIIKLVPHNAPTTPLGYPSEADPNSHDLSAPAVESLVRVKENVEGVLATSWDIADDGKYVIFNLRQGVKFHDGTDFNAKVAKWNLDNMIEAEGLAKVESVDIIDDYTIRFNLESWDNSILNDLERSAQMVSQTAVEENGVEWARWNPVGTGPFKFVEYERDVRLYYERNDNYWEEGKPYLDGIEYVVIADETVRKIALQNGEVHALRAAGTIAQELIFLGYDHNTIAGGTFVLIPDSANPDSPLSDRNVRLAISHAIDRETLARALGYGLANPAYQLYPGFSAALIPDLDIHEYDPDESKRLLSLAGYEEGDISITMHFFVIVPEDFAYAIASMLGEVGINAEVDYPDMGRYTDLRFGGWNDGIMGHALASGTNLNNWLKSYLAGVQFPSMKRASGFMEALDESLAAKSYDPEKIQAVIKLIHDDVMLIPYAEEVAITFFQEGVHDTGILEYSLDTWSFENAWLDPDLR